MKISQALSLFTHLVALIGFFALCVSGQVDVASIFIFVFSLTLSFINERFQKQYYLSQNIVTALAFALIAYVFLSVAFFNAELFNVILTFLVYTQVIKLLGKKDMKDLVQIYVLSFFHFLSGAILTVDFSYGITFIAYVCVALWATMIFSMRKESVEAPGGDDPEVITPLFLSTTVVISFCIFMLTALMFVSIPRIKSGFLTGAFLKPEALKSGFSDEVKLGRLGEIKLDTSPVMRVRVLNRDFQSLPDPIYWRGIALDEFDGTTWRVGDVSYEIHKSDEEGVVRVREAGNKVVSQEIITETLDTDILFAASLPVGFRGVVEGKVTGVNDSYMLPARTSYRLKYTAYSDLGVPSAEELRNEKDEYPASIKRRYLKLPPLSEKVWELAREVTRLDRNSYDKVVSIKRYLISNMSYTRTLEGGGGEFPVEDFLFQSKAGHCEYFATAMVVLLREVGIPSRIVNGFLGGEWNRYGGFFLVRESDAHSWVEVFFPERGWVLFDPTPAGGGESSGKNILPFIGSYLDYLKYRWARYVVDFNQGDQTRLFHEIQSNWTWQKGKLQNKADFKLRELDGGWLFALLFVALMTWALYTRSDLKHVFSYKKREPDEKASIVYKKALSLLSKKGFKKSDFVTPREFARDVISSGGKRFRSFLELTEKYLHLRFGGGNTKPELKELEGLFDRLKKETK